jgi:integrase
MARELERLSAHRVRRLIRSGKPGKWCDGGGLWLHVTKDGSYWFQRWGPQGCNTLSLGPTHITTLKRAREKSRDCRELVRDGGDPRNERAALRAAARVEAAKSVTGTQAIEAFYANHRPKWRSEKHAKEWRATLRVYAEPVLGKLPVGSIDTTLILKVIEPIWQTKVITASRVRQRLEGVLDFAKVRGWRDGDNPARWKGHLDHILPSPREIAPVEHYPAMPYADVPDFMRRLRTIDSVAARCLDFLVLTTARNKEARLACWSQIEGDVWKCPPEVMKRGKKHHVPLSAAAQAVIKRMRGQHADFVFPGRDGSIGDTALGDLLHELRGGCTVHGFRSSFRDWAGEETEFARELAEMALSHKVGDDTEEAYWRGDMLKRRRKMMEAWARYCSGASADVVPIRERRRG